MLFSPPSLPTPLLHLLRLSTAARRLPLHPDSVLAALSLYANDWPRALEFFQWAERDSRFRHTPATVSLAVDILGKHFEFELAWGLLSRHPHPLPLRSLLNRLSAARLVADAAAALPRAAALGLPLPLSFPLLLDALCEHRHVVEAQELCFNDPPPVPLGTKEHNILLRGWMKLRWWSKCRHFWEIMDHRGVQKDLRSYSIYMDVLSKSGKPWKTVKLFKEMRKKGITPDVVAYNTVIQAAGLSEGADCSIRFHREMLDSGLRPNIVTCNIVIKMLCHDGRTREAYEFLHRMDCEPEVITYHCFFQHLTRPKEILEMFDAMVRSGCRPRMETYTMLMKKFGRWGFLRPVLMVWKAMEEHGCSPDAFAYNAFIDALLQKGMVEMARRYDEEMLAKGLSAKPRKELGTKGLGVESDDNALSGVF